jgi:hypothetical protein
MATWAFGDENRFDLVATPRLPGMATEPESPPPPARPTRTRRPAILAVSAVLLAAAAFLALLARIKPATRERTGDASRAILDATAAGRERATASPSSPPPPSDNEARGISPEEVRRMTEALTALEDRFCPGSFETPAEDAAGPMRRLAQRLRYRGPTLAEADLAGLKALAATEPPGPHQGDHEPRHTSPDAANALRWHALILRFRDDRPLPEDFVHLPPRRQLAVLAWSFHLEDDPPVAEALHRGTAEEVVHAVADSLMVDAPLPHTSLSTTFPPLDDYRRFLGPLPRK